MTSKSARKKKRAKARQRSRGERMLLRYGWLLPILAVLIGLGILVMTYAFASIPLPKDIRLDSSAEVYDVNGKFIGTFTDEVTRFLIDTNDLPKYVSEAVVASEDKDFYEHGGISIRGIIRAGWANLTGGEIQQGGSTITQQYVKQAVLQDPSQTISRKIKEAILAIKLERRYSKKQILGFYLNTIYLGRGTYGIEAAARRYFDKHAKDLTLEEAAFLAGIIPSPESYQPSDNPTGARERRNRTLRLMAQQGYISEKRARQSMHGKVQLEGDQRNTAREPAAYFMEWLRQNYLYPEYGNELYTGGLKIYTTLDLDMQDSAENAITSVLNLKEDPEAALVSMTPRGEVRAMVGSRTGFTDVAKARGFNYATDFPGRQPGSSFKPFTLLTAIQEGISPSSTFSGRSPAYVDDPACEFDSDGDGIVDPWKVENFGGSSYGNLTLDQATTNSVNAVFAQLIAEVGPDKVVDTLDDFGFSPKYDTKSINPDCSNALGGALTVTPLEMARAYAGFAGRGRLPKVSPIRYIVDSAGNCTAYLPDDDAPCGEQGEYQGDQVTARNNVDVLDNILTHVVQSGTATAANIGRPVAGKTGTSQDFGNAWFAGFVPQLATIVWEGYPVETVKADAGSLVDGRVVPKSGKISVVPRMQYCADIRVCRPVHGYEVTGGGAPVSPAVMWANYMREAVAELAPLPFPIPTDLPDKVLNSPAPPPVRPVPTATKTQEPKPDHSPRPTPTTHPSPTTEPSPTVIPTTPGDGNGHGHGGKGRRNRGSGGDP